MFISYCLLLHKAMESARIVKVEFIVFLHCVSPNKSQFSFDWAFKTSNIFVIFVNLKFK